ncbi:MAG: IS200/IS605 family transposase [Bacteroidales bacterium]|nr:IS200/IS605 family transposase [Bacteroidales bacterium]
MSRTALLYHIIWRTRASEPSISENHERQLYTYILRICDNKNCKLHRINSMPDHIHILVSIRPDISVSQFVKIIKGESSKWLKSHTNWFPSFRGWGSGYAAFTYAENDKETIRQYIANQKQHHRNTPFYQEYYALMSEYKLTPDPETDPMLKD